METDVERIVRLETIVGLIPEMRDDIKDIKAYQDKQKGQATILGLAWSGILALGGAFTGWKIHGH